MRTRLAALDRTRQVMGEALQDSPYDPVINGYYITRSGSARRRCSSSTP